MPTEEKKYHSYDDLIEDMESVMKSLEMAVGVINGLNKAGWTIMNTTQFHDFAKECSRIRCLLHFSIQDAKELKKQNGKQYGVCPF